MTSYGRYTEFIEVNLESILVEVRVLESLVEINGEQICTNKWLLPYQWQEVDYILRAAAAKHFDANTVMTGPIVASGKDVEVVLKFIPFLPAYQYIIKPYDTSGNSLDALRDTGEKWLEQTPYGYMIVAVVSPVCVNGFVKDSHEGITKSISIGTRDSQPKHLTDDNFLNITWTLLDSHVVENKIKVENNNFRYENEIGSLHYSGDSSPESCDSFGSSKFFHEEIYSKYTGVVTKVYRDPVDDFTSTKYEPDLKFCDSMLDHNVTKNLRSEKVDTKTNKYDGCDNLFVSLHEKKKKGRTKCNSKVGEIYENSSDMTSDSNVSSLKKSRRKKCDSGSIESLSHEKKKKGRTKCNSKVGETYENSSDMTSDFNVPSLKKSRRKKCYSGSIESLSHESSSAMTSDSNCVKKKRRKCNVESQDKSKKNKSALVKGCTKISAVIPLEVCEVKDIVKQEINNIARKNKVKSASVNKLSSTKQRQKSISNIKEEVIVGELSNKTSTLLENDTENTEEKFSRDFENNISESQIKKRKSCTLNVDELLKLTSKTRKKVGKSNQGYNEKSANKIVCYNKELEEFREEHCFDSDSISKKNIISTETDSDDYVLATPDSTTQFSIKFSKSTVHNVKPLDDDFKKTEVAKKRKRTKPKSDSVLGTTKADSSGEPKQSLQKKSSKLSTRVSKKKGVMCNNIRSYFSPLPNKDCAIQLQNDKDTEERGSLRSSSDSVGILSDLSTHEKTEKKLQNTATDHSSSFEKILSDPSGSVSDDLVIPNVQNFEQNETNQNIRTGEEFSVKHLTSEDLEERFQVNVQYLSEILTGKRPCKRRDKYNAGGIRGLSRHYSLGTVPFSSDQLDHMLHLLKNHFCKKVSYVTMSDYIMTVLLPEACTKIFMDTFSLSHEDALRTIQRDFISSDHDNLPL